MQQTQISVIVPVYNVEEYLPKCLNSLINQTLKEIEIICINDGSADCSLDILETYAKQDSRIKIINKDNEGVSSARNIGLSQAQGKYLMFVDSDDYLELNACEKIYNKICEDNSDLLIFNYFSISNNDKFAVEHIKNLSETKFFYFNDADDNFFYVMTAVWGKLYKNNIQFKQFSKDLIKGEDTAFFWQYCLENNPKISILNEALYNYVERDKGAMFNPKYIKSCELFKTINYVLNLDAYKKAAPKTQAKIMDRFAQSICWEFHLADDVLNIHLPIKYYLSVNKLIKLMKSFDKNIIGNLRFYKKLRKNFFKSVSPINLQKIFSITNKPKRKVLTIFGQQIKFKYLTGQFKKEQKFIDLIKRNQKKYPKDLYLLFDCLHDNTVECIDAYSLFLYMKNAGKKAYYVILKDNYLYKKLELENNLDGIIGIDNSAEYPGDFLEKIYDILLRTKAVITSFGENATATNRFFKKNPYWQYIFIQHGQIFLKEDFLQNGYLYPKKFDKILVSSQNEANLLKKYKFKDCHFIKAGLPRWDLLQSTKTDAEKSILLMFTWRKLNLLNFDDSLYKKNILSLISNKDLQNYLAEKNIKIYFAPHHALLQNQGIHFNIENKNIKIISTNQISEYIKKSSLLITDFSSIAFDFMFQNKPVLYYILDKNDYLLEEKERESINTFDYKQYIMPNVYFDENSIIEKLKYYVENNFEPETDVKNKYDKFFYTKKDVRKTLVEKIDEVCKNPK